MTDPFQNEPRYLTELPEDLKRKRAAAARRRRWRRRLALGALVAVGGAVVALVVTGLGGGEGSKQARPTTTQTGPQAANQHNTGPTFPAGWKPHPGPVPVLEYHAIDTPSTTDSFPDLFVQPQDFNAQMQWLDRQGFEAVTLDQLEDAWYKHGKLPVKPIVISFDDGYLSQYENAFPVLQKLHWPGELNLTAQGSDLPDADVHKMLDAGWELASHTITHVDLTTVDSTTLEHEVAGSRQMLRQRFGVPVDNFCYPLGRYDDTVISAVHRAGYVGAQAEIPGEADAAHPYILDRIEILLSDGVTGFISKLRAAGAV
jgi:peptidoglycan/xylan/chitin deacetylase (PgdA/CDA1 family)